VSHRPLVFVFGLTLGDYLVWNWSLNGNHDVLALVSGLTLPPLAVACLWLLALSVARVIGGYTRRPSTQAAEHGAVAAEGAPTTTAASPEEASSAARSAGRSSGRLAA
jgi:hypothetical protein